MKKESREGLQEKKDSCSRNGLYRGSTLSSGNQQFDGEIQTKVLMNRESYDDCSIIISAVRLPFAHR